MAYPRKYIRLKDLGVLMVGFNVFVDESVILINPKKMSFGDNVRIDCFCLISAGDEGTHFGRNVHIAASCLIYGGGGRVTLEDYSSLSSRVTLYTASDDETGEAMTNPTVPEGWRKVTNGPVMLRRHAIVGNGSIIMPNVCVGFGAAVGPLSYVTRDVPDHVIVSGVPAVRIGTRSKNLLELGK
jgi:dTDP-4-amino-4,6-dideoxy-D-glucose acyltransferase